MQQRQVVIDMPRQKKEAKVLNIRLDISVSDLLDQYCADSGQTKTVAVERALSAYINDYYAERKLLGKLK